MKENRSSNIELLRIVTMLGIIVLHYNNVNIGGGFKYVQLDSINYYILSMMESLFICSVNVYILISGFYLCNSQKRSMTKILILFLQVILFSTGIYLSKIFVGDCKFTFRSLLSSVIPSNYFVVLYSALFIISPYINIVLKGYLAP